MTLYAKLRFENNNNVDNLAKIEEAAAAAIDYARRYYEYAVSKSNLNDDGLLQLTFVNGQNINKQDEGEETAAAQRNFDEKFAELINMEYSELNH